MNENTAAKTVMSRLLGLMILVSLPFLFVSLIGYVYSTFSEGVVVLVFGVVVTFLATMFASVGLTRRRWPTASGVVTHSEVKTTPGLFGWRDPDYEWLIVEYSYSVDGKELADSCSLKPEDDNAFKVIGGYPEQGMTVTVYHNPRNPSETLLVTGPGRFNLSCFVLGMIGIGVGCYLIWW